MDVYYIIFFIVFIFCFFDFVTLRQFRNFIYYLLCAGIILFVGFRKIGIDNDSGMYEYMYYFFYKATWTEIWKGGAGYVEIGYMALNKIFHSVFSEFRFFLFFIALSTGVLNYSYFLKKTSFPFLVLLGYVSFFFLYRDFTQIRYALSAAVCFWCVDAFIDKKYYKCLFLFLLAVCFHNAALILVPVLPFVKSFKYNLLLILLPIPCFLIGYSVNLFPLLLSTGLANEHMELYKNEEGGAGYALSVIGYLFVLIYMLLKNFVKKIEFTEKENFIFRIVALSISLNFLFIQSAIFQRFTYILFQFALILMSILVEKALRYTEKKESFILLYFILSVFLLSYGIRMVDVTLVRPYEIGMK